MIDLLSLGPGKTPTVLSFAAGAVPPKAASGLAIASSMSPAASEAGVLVVNPADNTTYFYMEGMNAASSNYKARGASATAVTIVDRSLKEREPGVYSGKVKIPAAGRYDVAFSLDSPKLLHCFSTFAEAGARTAAIGTGYDVQYLQEARAVPTGTRPFRFRIVDRGTGRAVTDLADVQVMWYRAPGADRTEVAAVPIGEGVYEATVVFPVDGAYYVHVASRTLRKGFRDLPNFSLVAHHSAKVAAGATAPAQ
jgi:hypothetical protein